MEPTQEIYISISPIDFLVFEISKIYIFKQVIE